jgi:co-chaperonin GroES (HSP10)
MIIPVTHRILVKPVDIMDKDEHLRKAKELGLIVHKDEKDREQAAVDEGVVVDFGPTAFLAFDTENPLKKGDTVVYARYAGKVIVDPDDEIKYVALNDEDVVAIITKKGA